MRGWSTDFDIDEEEGVESARRDGEEEGPVSPAGEAQERSHVSTGAGNLHPPDELS